MHHEQSQPHLQRRNGLSERPPGSPVKHAESGPEQMRIKPADPPGHIR